VNAQVNLYKNDDAGARGELMQYSSRLELFVELSRSFALQEQKLLSTLQQPPGFM